MNYKGVKDKDGFVADLSGYGENSKVTEQIWQVNKIGFYFE